MLLLTQVNPIISDILHVVEEEFIVRVKPLRLILTHALPDILRDVCVDTSMISNHPIMPHLHSHKQLFSVSFF
ncbi:hypothetical protein EB796_017193 [Bugula neritina]|uniref:Uncharacterized protein n=1 Tax=Bugula neritina TaxID=10212 RepID=A0A7J7JF80_BUGNE|nr:hypothetical protein EB796_017193 [Bugula neritina]